MFVDVPAKSRDLAKHYRAIAAERGVRFFDAGSVATSSTVDGFHLDPDAHEKIGKAIAAEIAGIFK
jgi:lysophospholipase L1-like esterase